MRFVNSFTGFMSDLVATSPHPSASFVAGICSFDLDELPARISVPDSNNIVLRFDAESRSGEPIPDLQINLIGVLETKIIPDPSVALQMNFANRPDDKSIPSLLLITYLEDMFDSSSVKTILFSAITRDLDAFQQVIGTISKDLQRRLLFQIPDLAPSKTGKKLKPERPVDFALIPAPPGFLDGNEIGQLRLALPLRMRHLSWERVFKASIDGVSLATMYQKSAKRMPLLLLVLTADHGKLGAYLSTGLARVKGYTGTGETFVFGFSPAIRVYRWSQKNEHFYLASENDISIGGGGGSAIFLTDALQRGFSSPCETFDSEMLTQKNQFDIMDLEVWHIRRHP
jgi:hypothetical protein